MDPVILTILVILIMLLFIAIGMPIAFALALSGSIGIVLIFDTQTLFYSLGSFPVSRIAAFIWTVIPLFILMGNLAQASGVASEAYSMANKWLGHLRGGLVVVTIGACGLIAATTASGATGTAVMGRIAVPEMRKYGYDMRLATGATAASGTVGILIPPSGPLVVIGILTGLSIGKLFAAGFLPGVISVLIYMIMVNVKCRLNPTLAPKTKRYDWKQRFRSLSQGWGVVVLFITVMGGLYTGIATPTEVAALGCSIALLMAMIAFFRGKCNKAMLLSAVVGAVDLSVMIFAFIVGAGIFSLFLTMGGIVPLIVDSVKNLPLNPTVILILILLSYIPLGMFLDTMSMVLLTLPLYFPIIQGLGFDGIWFSILIIKAAELGAITPPVGMAIFVMKGVYPEAKLEDITRGCLWFMLMDVITISILVAFPSISTWLPNLMAN